MSGLERKRQTIKAEEVVTIGGAAEELEAIDVGKDVPFETQALVVAAASSEVVQLEIAQRPAAHLSGPDVKQRAVDVLELERRGPLCRAVG